MDQSLIAWKSTPNKKPLVLFGARQTGKTTSVLDFAKREYQHLVFIDFYRQPEMKAAFTASREPQAIIMALKALLRIDITPANTLLFFDEIRTAMTQSPRSNTSAPMLQNTTSSPRAAFLVFTSLGKGRSPLDTSTCSPCTPWTSKSIVGHSMRSAHSTLRAFAIAPIRRVRSTTD